MDHLEQAAKELADIERLEKQEAEARKAREERKEKLRAFTAMGASLFGASPPPAVVAQITKPARSLAVAATKPGRKGTAKARIEEIATELIQLHGYMQTETILEVAEQRGVQIGAANKPLAVSAILSRSPDFKSDRAKGWSLTNKKPDSAPTLPGFSLANAT